MLVIDWSKNIKELSLFKHFHSSQYNFKYDPKNENGIKDLAVLRHAKCGHHVWTLGTQRRSILLMPIFRRLKLGLGKSKIVCILKWLTKALLKSGFRSTLKDLNHFLVFLSQTHKFKTLVHFFSQMNFSQHTCWCCRYS